MTDDINASHPDYVSMLLRSHEPEIEPQPLTNEHRSILNEMLTRSEARNTSQFSTRKG